MEKQIILEDDKGLVNVELKEVYKAVKLFHQNDVELPKKLARFKKKEDILECSKSILNHRVKMLTGRSIKELEVEMCYTPDDPNETGMDMDTLEVLAHFLILFSNGIKIIPKKSTKRFSNSLLSSPPVHGYMESTRIETPKISSKTQRNPSKSPSRTPSKSTKQSSKTKSQPASSKCSSAESSSSDSEDEQPSGKSRYVGTTPDTSIANSVDASKSKLSWINLLIYISLLSSILLGSHHLYQQSRPKLLLYVEQDPYTESHWTEARAHFSSKLKQIREMLPNQSRKSWLSISSAVKSTMKLQPEYPAVLLLLANQTSERTAACFASQIAMVAAEILGDDPTKDDIIIKAADLADVNIQKRKQDLTDSLHAILSSARSVAILQVERLHPQVAMTLHAFTDNANAPYKRSVIVMTLLDDIEDSDATADAKAEELLVKSWGDELGDDKVYALVSRVAVNVIEVQQEGQDRIKWGCPLM